MINKMFKQSILITIFHNGTCIGWSNVLGNETSPGRLSCTLRLKVSYCDAIKLFFFVLLFVFFLFFVVVIVMIVKTTMNLLIAWSFPEAFVSLAVHIPCFW